ncbi:MAG TPA: hypothetical protein VFD19_00145 [Clostridia bacterium]|nr:hypothetical protein [Clostridia bacterium]
MKKLTVLLLAAIMVLTLVACGSGGNDLDSTKSTGGDALVRPVYTVDVETLDPNVYPDDYPLIAIEDFEAAFEELAEGIYEGTLDGYQDVVDLFGVDGAYYENCDLEQNGQLYKYYGWYADSGVSVFVTFKSDGDNLKCYAYTGNGIIPKRS